MRLESKWAALAFWMVVLSTSSLVRAGDWPTWRYDGARSSATGEQLPDELHVRWRRDHRPLAPAWPEDPRQYFDASYQPVVMGDTMFVASSRNDSVTALDTESGERINLGAPGDRLSAAGTLWLDYPSVGGSSPTVQVKLTGSGRRMFQTHSALVEGESLRWVAASGVEGASGVRVTLNGDPAKAENRRYTVRLVFAEPNDLKPTERVFQVSLQGKEVLSNFDVVREAGGRNRVVVREFWGVVADKELIIGLEPAAGQSVLSGVEIVAEAR